MASFNWPPSGSGSGVLKYADFVSLPSVASDGDLAVTLDTDTVYIYSSPSNIWVPISAPGAPLSVLDTNSINLTIAANILSADLLLSAAAPSASNQAVSLNIQADGLRAQISNASITGLFSVTDTNSIDFGYSAGVITGSLKLSATAAGAGFLKATDSIQSDGLLTLIPEASTSQTGVLTSTNWNTFNGKQAAGNYIIALTGDVAAAGPGSVAATIQPNVVSDAKFRQSAALSIIGNSTNATANVADITAGTDSFVFRRAGTSLGFGLLTNVNIDPAAAIAFSKLATLTSGNLIVGSAGGVATSIAMSGDATIIASGALTIANNAVTNAKLAQMPTLTMKGNNTGGTANALDLTVTQVNTMLGTLTNPMSAIGDTIYGGAAGVPTRLAPGNAGEILQSNGGAAPNWSKINAYVGTNPEVGGSSPFQMVVTNARTQIINPAGAITIKLPTTGVLAGEVHTITNRSANLVTIQSSGANDIYAVNLGVVSIVSLQATPTTAAHWEILNVNDQITGTIGASGNYTSGGIYKVARSDKVVTLVISTALAHASLSSASSAVGFIPAKFAPVYTATTIASWDSAILQFNSVDTAGTILTSYKDWAGTNTAQTSSKASTTLSWVV